MSRRIFCRVLVAAISIMAFLLLPTILIAQGRSDAAFERVREVQERHTERLLAIDGVEGTGVGLDENGQPAVKVFLSKPGVAGIPKKLDDVQVHAIVTGKFQALPKSKSEQVTSPAWFPRPVPIGVSTGNKGQCSAGTIGCSVKDGAGKVYALSNNHVYALENKARIGSEVLQPGLYDTGCVYSADNVIGTLAKFVPINFTRSAKNTVDAAIALSSTDKLGNATPSNGYGTPSNTTVAAYLGQAVQKYGRTTSLTKGSVYVINATVKVSYSRGIAQFVKQIIITPGGFSAAGDSGSLIVTDPDRNPVGLLFAGSSTMTVANPIDLVLTSLGVSVDGQ